MGRFMLISKNTSPRAAMFAALCIVGVAAAANLATINVASAQASKSAAIVVPNNSFDTIAKAGQKVTTACFVFTAPVKSRIRGSGCRVYAFVQGEKSSFDTPYASLEVLSDDPPGLSLDAVNKLTLDALEAAELKRAYRNPKRAKYDTVEGKYLGSGKAAINDMPAIFNRWAQENNPNVNNIEIGCPEKDALTKSPELAPYVSVTTRMISYVPAGRFVWDGKPQRFFMAYGRIKACDGPYFNRVMGTFTLL